MKKILTSLSVVAVIAVVVIGATTAFFSDTETSSGNTFTAGALDLKIDNDSYYNGNRCTNSGTQEQPNFLWQGTASYPEPGTPCETSFPLSDLDAGLLFFNFTDLKPDDEGEDTISIHVQNDAWACMDVTLTSDDDRSSTEPELEVDTPDDINNTWDGELADSIEMFWWADDGDNVYEVGEWHISDGVETLSDFASTTGAFSVPLADAAYNVWDPNNPGAPLPGGETVYIAKAWCFGNLTLAPVPAGEGVNPSVATGVVCDGTLVGNAAQTDGVTLDVAFRAIQSRNNPDFICEDERLRTAKINVIKQVVNDNGGNNVIADFQLFVDNGVTSTPVTSSATTTVSAGTYTVGETGISGYVATFSGDCDASGQITLADGDEKYCVITNNDQEAHITLIKNVINNNEGTATASNAWGLKIDGNIVNNNSSVTVNSNAPHLINENGRAGYHFVSITGAGCPAATSTPIVLNEGESITCTITNDDN